MKFFCIKQLIMDDDSVGFIKGKTYDGVLDEHFIGAVNLTSEVNKNGEHFMSQTYMETYFRKPLKFGK